MLVRYIGSLFAYGVTEGEALKIVLKQNKLNHPPLPGNEVVYTGRDCYRRFRKREGERMREKPNWTHRGVQEDKDPDRSIG